MARNKSRRHARRHHVVSKFYLRRFANPKQQVTRLPRGGNKSYIQSIKDATVQNDFYTIRQEDTSPDAFESQLGIIESEAAKSFEQVFKENIWPLADDSRDTIARWIALQFIRGTNKRQQAEEMYRELSKLGISARSPDQLRKFLNLPSGISESEVDSYCAQERERIDKEKVDSHYHLSAISGSLEPVMEAVYSRPWRLVRFKKAQLGTSDTPVVLPSDSSSPFRGMGMGNAEIVFVPLSARCALILGNLGAKEYDDEVEGDFHLARWLNYHTLYNSHRAVYYHPDSNPFDDFDIPEPRTREMKFSQPQWVRY